MKLYQAVVVVCVLVVGTLAWAYPVNVTTELTPNVTAVVEVLRNGEMQYANVQFMVNGGSCGSYMVGSMVTEIIRFQDCIMGDTRLRLSRITFQQATPMQNGRVYVLGEATNLSDGFSILFNRSVAEWTY